MVVHWDANGLDLDFNSGAASINSLALPGSPANGARFTFGARTGSSSAEQRTDNVSITIAAQRPAAVPTVSEWGAIAMILLFAGLGARALRRRGGTARIA